MLIEWNRSKADVNWRKHGVDFADAAAVLFDDQAITIRDRFADEERYVSVECDALMRVLVLIYAWRGESVRLISARKATRSERRQYEDRQ